jgi:hypothetical protein
VLNTYEPSWDEDITPDSLSSSNQGSGGGGRITAAALMANMGSNRWGVAVVDDDGSSLLNDAVCAVTPNLTAADFTAGTVSFPNTGSCLSLTIQLQCAE